MTSWAVTGRDAPVTGVDEPGRRVALFDEAVGQVAVEVVRATGDLVDRVAVVDVEGARTAATYESGVIKRVPPGHANPGQKRAATDRLAVLMRVAAASAFVTGCPASADPGSIALAVVRTATADGR